VEIGLLMKVHNRWWAKFLLIVDLLYCIRYVFCYWICDLGSW
jgi:hypothetical protein